MAQKIKTFLWFDIQADEAASFYTSIFKGYGGTIVRTRRRPVRDVGVE